MTATPRPDGKGYDNVPRTCRVCQTESTTSVATPGPYSHRCGECIAGAQVREALRLPRTFRLHMDAGPGRALHSVDVVAKTIDEAEKQGKRQVRAREANYRIDPKLTRWEIVEDDTP
jgi:hypothetical protein